jgi:hypothetical protein
MKGATESSGGITLRVEFFKKSCGIALIFLHFHCSIANAKLPVFPIPFFLSRVCKKSLFSKLFFF